MGADAEQIVINARRAGAVGVVAPSRRRSAHIGQDSGVVIALANPGWSALRSAELACFDDAREEKWCGQEACHPSGKPNNFKVLRQGEGFSATLDP